MDSEKFEKILGKLCDEYCKYPCQFKDVDELEDICDACPMNELIGLLD